MTPPLVPAGARVEFVEHAGGRVRVLRGGPAGGTPVVLVHGGGPDNAAISWFEALFDAELQIEAREEFLAEIGPFLRRIDDEHDRGAAT